MIDMMDKLTVYLVPGHPSRSDVSKCVYYLEKVFIEIPIVITKDRKDLVKKVKYCTTPWYVVLFTDEFLSMELSEVLPIYTLAEDYDFFSLYGYTKDEGGKVYLSPRIFNKRVKINQDVNPIMTKGLKYEKILDGYVFRLIDFEEELKCLESKSSNCKTALRN
jgi:hypothetical protein